MWARVYLLNTTLSVHVSTVNALLDDALINLSNQQTVDSPIKQKAGQVT